MDAILTLLSILGIGVCAGIAIVIAIYFLTLDD